MKSSFTERTARDLARRIIAVPGWASNLDSTIAGLGSLRASLTSECTAHPGVIDPNRTAGAIHARAAVILREVATASPEVVLSDYLDLLPADLRAKLMAGAIAVLTEVGAIVETFKDDSGETFLQVQGLDPNALGIPAEEMDRIIGMVPGPVGQMHRVQ